VSDFLPEIKLQTGVFWIILITLVSELLLFWYMDMSSSEVDGMLDLILVVVSRKSTDILPV
jgi:hypothetical protein